jgi:hypothetical protein
MKEDCEHDYETVNTFAFEKELQPSNVFNGPYKVKRTQVVKKCKKCGDVQSIIF